MLRLSSLRTKLTLLYAGLFAVALAAIATVVSLGVARNAEATVRDQLVASGTVFDRIWTLRSNQLGEAAGLLARDYGFREAVATREAVTVESALDNLKTRLKLKTAFLIDTDGGVTGASRAMTEDAKGLWAKLDSGATAGVVTLGGMSYQMIAAPVLAPELAGWVVFAVPLDAREMAALENLSSIPLTATVLRRDAVEGWVTGPDEPPATVAFVEAATSGNAPSVGHLDLKRGEAIALVKPLQSFGGGSPAALLLRYPLAKALQPYQPLKAMIAGTGLVGLLLLLLASWRLAAGITRPISALDSAARRLEEGERVEVAVESDDEIGRLAVSFNKMALGIAEREQRITHMAFHDTLTGLPNRALFGEQLDQYLRLAERRGRKIAVLCLDLDNFKAVNDTLGHPVGDALLEAVAVRLKQVAGDSLVARFGGDEFAMIVEAESSSPETVALKLLGMTEQPFEADGHELSIGMSIGIAIAPTDGADPITLLKNADLALNRTKSEGRAGFRFFEAAMDAEAQARRAIENDLRQALARGELALAFQPLFHLRKNEISGFEALLRWHHPVRGMVPPAEFISIAEETGLIMPIGDWVIEEACRQAMLWPSDACVAVNVSPVQFRNPALGPSILRALSKTGLPAQRLEIEITESIFLEGSEATLAVLHSLRKIGVRIALDDFGTGYSSLSYLRSFPFDKLKIDRSFIMELMTEKGASAIVRAIIALADALGMETTAEGVEDEGQMAALREQGASSVQGFLFSKPVAAEQVAGLFERYNRAAKAA